MKRLKILTLVSMLLSLGACSEGGSEQVSNEAIMNPLSAENDGQIDSKKLPIISFEKDFHDFGLLSEGEKVTYSFRFSNTGKSDLILQTASGSCGCTVPEIPKKPIRPGESAFIKVQFDSEGRPGVQEKTVTVVSNAIPNTTTIRIRAEVQAR
jgi:hypothetical protein